MSTAADAMARDTIDEALFDGSWVKETDAITEADQLIFKCPVVRFDGINQKLLFFGVGQGAGYAVWIVIDMVMDETNIAIIIGEAKLMEQVITSDGMGNARVADFAIIMKIPEAINLFDIEILAGVIKSFGNFAGGITDAMAMRYHTANLGCLDDLIEHL